MSTKTGLPEHLWRVPVYLPYLQPPLTARAVAAAEAKLKVKLPAAYLEALRIQNGGYLRLDQHPSDLAPVSNLYGIGPHLPSLVNVDWDVDKEYMAEEGLKKPARIDDLIPFCGDGHYHFCLDYRKDGRRREPRVTYVDIESQVEKVLAPNFGAFLRSLRSEPEVAQGLVTTLPLAKVAAELAKVSGLDFEKGDAQAHGYATCRARLPGKDPSWAWLCPNRVRRGFVRPNHERYDQLKALLPELVDRYPEHADCGYILSCSAWDSPAGRRLVRGLAKLSFPSRPIPI
jgi:hypothetical protein